MECVSKEPALHQSNLYIFYRSQRNIRIACLSPPRNTRLGSNYSRCTIVQQPSFCSCELAAFKCGFSSFIHSHTTVLRRQSGRSNCYIESKTLKHIWSSAFIFIADTIWHNLMRYCAAWHIINGPTARFHFGANELHIYSHKPCCVFVLLFKSDFPCRLFRWVVSQVASRKVA